MARRRGKGTEGAVLKGSSSTQTEIHLFGGETEQERFLKKGDMYCGGGGALGSIGQSELTCKEDLSTADGFPGPGPGALHQGPLLRQQQVVLRLVNQVSEKKETQPEIKKVQQHLSIVLMDFKVFSSVLFL